MIYDIFTCEKFVKDYVNKSKKDGYSDFEFVGFSDMYYPFYIEYDLTLNRVRLYCKKNNRFYLMCDVEYCETNLENIYNYFVILSIQQFSLWERNELYNYVKEKLENCRSTIIGFNRDMEHIRIIKIEGDYVLEYDWLNKNDWMYYESDSNLDYIIDQALKYTILIK